MTPSSFVCGKEYPTMKGFNTCTPLFSINRHYITSNIALLKNKESCSYIKELPINKTMHARSCSNTLMINSLWKNIKGKNNTA